MAWGFFKKIKNGLKKAADWLKNAIPKVRNAVNKAKPLVLNLFDDKPKIKKIIEDGSDIINVADDAITKKDYKGAVDWTKTNIMPRLKGGFR